jgi:ethanolamine utilization protein EutN
VALDLVGAGEGDVVLVTTGSAARVAEPATEAPTDCTVVAIADSVIWQGSVTYTSHLQHVTGDSED